MFRFQNFSVSKLSHFLMVSDLVSKKIGIEKSIGFGIGKIWFRKKVSDSVSFRFLVSSHTASVPKCPELSELFGKRLPLGEP